MSRALFAGTFDPFHISHFQLLKTFEDLYSHVDIVLHKYSLRKNHKRMFCEDYIINTLIPKFINEYGLSATWNTYIKETESFYDLLIEFNPRVLIFGFDVLEKFYKWKNYERLIEWTKNNKPVICFARRNVYKEDKYKDIVELLRNAGAEIIVRDIKFFDEYTEYYSGTLFRERITEKLIKYPHEITLPPGIFKSAVVLTVKTKDNKYILIKHKISGKYALIGGYIDEPNIENVIYKELYEEASITKNLVEYINFYQIFTEIDNVVVLNYIVLLKETSDKLKLKPIDKDEVENVVIFDKKQILGIPDNLFRFKSHKKLIQEV